MVCELLKWNWSEFKILPSKGEMEWGSGDILDYVYLNKIYKKMYVKGSFFQELYLRNW